MAPLGSRSRVIAAPSPVRTSLFVPALQLAAAVVLVGAAVFAAVRFAGLIMLFVVAAIVARALTPSVSWLETRGRRGRRIPRAVAALLLVLGATVLVAALAALVIVPTGRQVGVFLSDANQRLYEVGQRGNRIQAEFGWLPDMRGVVDRLLASVKARTRDGGAAEAARLGLHVLQGIGVALALMVATFFMLLRPPAVERIVLWAAPHARRVRVRLAFARVSRHFHRWMKAQLILAGVVGSANFASSSRSACRTRTCWASRPPSAS